jgi:hypothetical protein
LRPDEARIAIETDLAGNAHFVGSTFVDHEISNLCCHQQNDIKQRIQREFSVLYQHCCHASALHHFDQALRNGLTESTAAIPYRDETS